MHEIVISIDLSQRKKKDFFGICLDDQLLPFDGVFTQRQGELLGKGHLSNRCFALAVWKDFHLLRRQTCCRAINPSPTSANIQLCRGVPPGQSAFFSLLSKQIPEETKK
jgi:hypothetical protein